MTFQHLKVANEMIAYQGKSFLAALTSAVERLRAAGRGQKTVFDFTVDVDRIIAEYTGIMVTTRTVMAGKQCMISSPIIGRGNVLSRDNYENFEKYDTARNNGANGKLEGFIDAERGRVSGDFSKLPHKLVIGEDRLFSSKYDCEEIATKIIHEVGHAYGYLSYAAVFAIRNAQLQSCLNAMHAEKDAGKYKLIIDRTRERMGLGASEILKKEGGDADKVFILAASEITEDLVKKDPRGIYTYDTAEELADVFATRHGAGAVLARLRLKDPHTAADRTYFERNRSRMFVMFVLWIAGASTGYFGAVIFALLFATSTVDALVEIIRPEKTSSAQLIGNIRNEMVQSLKEQGLADKELIRDIDLVIERLEMAKMRVNKDYFRELFNFFVPGRNHVIRVREYQDRLSGMANNDLFVMAAKLKNGGF